MKTFEFESLEKAYPEILKSLLEEGKEVSPRGMLTKEISPACITITNPRKRVIPSLIRKLNFGFMCAELVWILQGSNDAKFIGHYNKQWLNYSDDGTTLNGAYGNRIFNWDSGMHYIEDYYIDENGIKSPLIDVQEIRINQFQKAYEQLKKDPDTRQATIVFFDPNRDYSETKDKPCTNLIRFMIRENKLNMTVFMRSNDIWFGTPYDIFNFTMLQEIMAGMLNVEVGVYNHIVDSLHIYETHFEKAKELINENYPLLYNNCMDAKVSINKVNTELNYVFRIERLTRENKDANINDVINGLNLINNEYWKSVGAVLAVYNFRKHKRKQDELNVLKQYITNEFKTLVEERYNELKPKNKEEKDMSNCKCSESNKENHICNCGNDNCKCSEDGNKDHKCCKDK